VSTDFAVSTSNARAVGEAAIVVDNTASKMIQARNRLAASVRAIAALIPPRKPVFALPFTVCLVEFPKTTPLERTIALFAPSRLLSAYPGRRKDIWIICHRGPFFSDEAYIGADDRCPGQWQNGHRRGIAAPPQHSHAARAGGRVRAREPRHPSCDPHNCRARLPCVYSGSYGDTCADPRRCRPREPEVSRGSERRGSPRGWPHSRSIDASSWRHQSISARRFAARAAPSVSTSR